MKNSIIARSIRCVLAVAVIGACMIPLAKAANPKNRPNVVFILADDLGYGDMSFLGQEKFSTPNIDKLAENGRFFTDHYSGSAVCAPSRCALMTGLHMGHAPVRGNAETAPEVSPEGQNPMPGDTFTVAKLLQKAGYKTGVFGKWGLGYPGSESDPLNMGFDHFFGYNCQRIAHSYYPAFLWNDDERELLWGNVAEKSLDYAPDFIHEKTLSFIRTNKDQPFFCYYALVQPHADMVAPEGYMEKYRGKFDPETAYPDDYYNGQEHPKAAFAAMVNVLDDYVGDVVAELEAQGIAENTLVIFTSDNGSHTEGGHDPEYFDSNGNNRGFKRDLYEGGVHVPMIASWPGTIEEGSISGHLSAFWDFLPTMAELVGEPIESSIDGVSMLPSLLGKEGQKEHEYLYWEFHAKGGRLAIRKGNWKGVRYNVAKDPGSKLELYDLSLDPSETNNVAEEYPEVVASLVALMGQARVDAANPNFNFITEAE